MKRSLLLVSVLALPMFATATWPAPAPGHGPRPGAPSAPQFSLPARDGTVTLDALRGQPLLVDFWASWCTPCRASFPWLARMQQRYAAHGLRVVAINLDKDRADAAAFLARIPAPFTVAFDPAGTTAEAFHVKAMPSTFLVSREGTIVFSHAGFDARRTQDFETRIQEACAP